MLWNDMNAVKVVDDHFAISISDNSIIVSELVDSLQAFEISRVVPVDYAPTRLKEYDTLLVVCSEDFSLSAYRISSLPDLECLWTVSPGIPFADYVFHDRSLYLSSWYNGLWRFSFDASFDAVFVDSSMVGIMMTQLAIEDDTLYALDEYNGIMRYALDGNGFGQFIDYLYVPKETSGFVCLDTTLLILLKTDGVLIGSFDHQGSGVTDSLVDVGHPRRIYKTSGKIVLVENRYVRVMDLTNFEITSMAEIETGGVDGDLFQFKGRNHLILPRKGGGLIAFDLLDVSYPRVALHRSGPVNDLLLVDGKLITGGGDNPIDVYTLDADLLPQYNYTMYKGLKNVQALDNNGDTLVAYYAGLNKVIFMLNALDPDSFYVERSFFLDDTLTGELQLLDHKIDTLRALIAVGETSVQAYTISDSGFVTQIEPWHFIGRVSSVLVHDTLLFVATTKNQIWTHRIMPGFELERLSIVDISASTYELTWFGDRLMVFVQNDLVIYDMTDPRSPQIDTVINLPFTVLESELVDDRLYAIGPEGIGVFDLTSSLPVLMSVSGKGGSMLAVEGNVLVASDGTSLDIYYLSDDDQPDTPRDLPDAFVLQQNYPNPFNAGTTIRYSLPTRSHVKIDIINILGQKVRTLVDAEQPADSYETYWDGTNSSRHTVATGVYFYRFRAGDISVTRKMLLLK